MQRLRSALAVFSMITMVTTVRADDFSAIEHQRETIYHSPQKPGFTSWVGAWTMSDGSLMVSFTQATGPVEGRPQAPKEVQHKLTWPPPEHPGYDMTGLELRKVDQSIVMDSFRQVAADIAVADPKPLVTDKLVAERVPLGEPDDYKPCIARLPSGELLLTAFHQHKRDGNKVMEQTLLFRSPDGGRTWTGPQPLDLLGREPYLTVLKNGTVFITGHLLAQDVRNEWGYTTGFLHRSTDGGRTWQSTRVESEQIKPKASNHTTRNVLELSDGTLLLGVDYDGGGGPYFVWRSTDGGQTWDKSQKCEPKDFKSQYGFFGGETWLWQARSGKVWALVRVDSNEMPIKDRPIKAGNDQADHFLLFSSSDGAKTFDRIRDFGDYGEMYMSLLRLQDKRLLLTFTVRDLKPPLGVRAIIGTETDDGFEFDFAHDRIMLDTKTPIGQPQGGGFGPTVQLDDGTLVTSYSYRGEDGKSHLEVVRWKTP